MYPYWGRILGMVFIVAGIVIFLKRVFQYGIFDLSGASLPIGFGLMMVFFSKEKDFDERIAYLKFKALAVAVPVATILTMLINYSQNFQDYSIETDTWFSISAFEFLSIVLIIAIGWFYYLRYRE